MLETEPHGDVTRVIMWSHASRAVGYDVSAYLVRGYLVDTGFPAVAREVASLLDHRSPRGAIVTHHHEDHAGNIELIARGGMPVAASDATIAALRHAEPIRWYRRATWGQPVPFTSTPCELVPEGLELIPAPGHCADHIVVWDADTETIFGGDIFLGVKVRTAQPDEHPRQLVRTLRAIAGMRPARLFDGHRGAVHRPMVALMAKADWLERLIATVDDKVQAGWSDRAITRHTLGREPMAYYGSRGELSKINLVRAIRLEAAV
jgi:glyoxylase-like metal-dependent hydrolase (beta-lactamase superfamily II)